MAPSLVGFAEGASVGGRVGIFETVGRGEIVGFTVGVEEGAGEAVGLEVGDAVGLGVTKRSQTFDVASIQVGLNNSN